MSILFNLINKKIFIYFLSFTAIYFTFSFHSNADTSELQIKKPDVLKVALGNEPDSGFDPILGWGKYGNPLFQSTLLKRDKKLNFIGDLATNWRLTNNKLTWIIHLREDVKFSNGMPLTAEDVAFTYNQILQQASVHDLATLKVAEPLTKYSVVFHLTQSDITFLDRLSSIGIVPKQLYLLQTNTSRYGASPIGSGPYVLTKWKKNQYVSMELNPYYYGKKPIFPRLITVFGGEESRFLQLKNRQLDLSVIPQRYASQVIPDYKLWAIDTLDNRGIVWPMNYNKAAKATYITSDPVIRQVFDYLIDKKLIAEKLLDGYATPAYSVADNMPWGVNTKHISQEKINVDHAITLLENAGWHDSNNNGIIDKHGNEASFDLLYKAGDSLREQLALTISSIAAQIGVNINVKGLEWNEIALRMANTPVLMGFGSHSASEVNYMYHSRNAHTDFYNSGGYNNPIVDAAIDNALKSSSWDESLPFWQLAQKQIQKDRPWTWLVNIKHLYLARDCLDLGIPMTEPHDHGWPLTANIEEWRWKCP